jgi:predicted ATP-dependent Lon-type protease
MVLYGFDGTTVAGGGGTDKFLGWQTGGGAIASAFSNIDVYFPNYASSNYKSYSADLVAENNSSSAYILNLMASSWSDATAISSIQILCETHSFAVNSSFYLYGISKT